MVLIHEAPTRLGYVHSGFDLLWTSGRVKRSRKIAFYRWELPPVYTCVAPIVPSRAYSYNHLPPKRLLLHCLTAGSSVPPQSVHEAPANPTRGQPKRTLPILHPPSFTPVPPYALGSRRRKCRFSMPLTNSLKSALLPLPIRVRLVYGSHVLSASA